MSFCQEPSDRYLDLLDEAGGDPRVAAGLVALQDLETYKGWVPSLDARDSRKQGGSWGRKTQPDTSQEKCQTTINAIK